MSKWHAVRGAFALNPAVTHFAAMSLVSHPAQVRCHIDAHRAFLDAQPLTHVFDHFSLAEETLAQAVGAYFGIDPSLVALTSSTTMGLAQVLGGVALTREQEVLTSDAEHFTTVETLKLRKARDGATSRPFRLYQRASTATSPEILQNVRNAIRKETRVLSLAWVYSSDGLKIPLRDVADIVAEVNRDPDRQNPANRLLLSIDGVHGFGVEDTTFAALKCDFFIAGCHKWVFGPRGTSIICATHDAWSQVLPLVPTFSSPRKGLGRLHSPGGVHAYEHTFSLPVAINWLLTLGKPEIAARVRQLVDRLREGLAQKGCQIETPAVADLSSGLVCFSHPKEPPAATVARLAAARIVLTPSWPDPAGNTHVRASVAIYNDEADIDRLIAAI